MASSKKTVFEVSQAKLSLAKKHQERVRYYQKLRNRRLMDMAALFSKMSEEELKKFIRQYPGYVYQVIELRADYFKSYGNKSSQGWKDYSTLRLIVKQARENGNKVAREKAEEFRNILYSLCRCWWF